MHLTRVADLEAGGGRVVAALLRRAARLPPGDMAAEMCLDASWEKLHTGSWSEVGGYSSLSLLPLSV